MDAKTRLIKTDTLDTPVHSRLALTSAGALLTDICRPVFPALLAGCSGPTCLRPAPRARGPKSDNDHYVKFQIWNVIAISTGYRAQHPREAISETRERLLREA